MGHVFARLTGFGMTLIPFWPYTFERAGHAQGTVRVTRWDGETPLTATVAGPADASSDVVGVMAGPAEDVWRIETSPFSVEWPDGFAIESPPEGDDSTPFLLIGSAGAMIYPQGPYHPDRIPPLAELVAPDQTLVGQRTEPGFDVVELAYQHDGAAWRQSHHLVALTEDRKLVITAQAPATEAVRVRNAAELMARSAIPR